MSFLRNMSLLVLLFAATALAGTPATGRSEMQPFRWKSAPIKIYVSTSLTKANPNIKADSDVMAAVRASLKAWSDAADVTFEVEASDKQSVSPAGPAGDGVSLITIASTPENVLFFSKDLGGTAARTRAFYSRRGAITEADIVLNPFQQFSTDGSYGTFDLQAVLAHEIGHLIGLKHSDVRGSVMCDNLSKNSSGDGVITRGLSDSDIAAARDLYGTADLMDDCCSVVTGKLAIPDGPAVREVRIWAEDKATGRVAAESEVASDGSFRIGGVSAGTYRLIARSRSGAFQELSTVELGPVDQKVVNKAVTFHDAKFSMAMIGLDGHLSESAAAVAPGTDHLVYVGGVGIDRERIRLTMNSPYFEIDGSTLSQQQASSDASVLSFNLKVAAEAPAGVYSLFASAGPGTRSVLIGAIRVP